MDTYRWLPYSMLQLQYGTVRYQVPVQGLSRVDKFGLPGSGSNDPFESRSRSETLHHGHCGQPTYAKQSYSCSIPTLSGTPAPMDSIPTLNIAPAVMNRLPTLPTLSRALAVVDSLSTLSITAAPTDSLHSLSSAFLLWTAYPMLRRAPDAIDSISMLTSTLAAMNSLPSRPLIHLLWTSHLR